MSNTSHPTTGVGSGRYATGQAPEGSKNEIWAEEGPFSDVKVCDSGECSGAPQRRCFVCLHVTISSRELAIVSAFSEWPKNFSPLSPNPTTSQDRRYGRSPMRSFFVLWLGQLLSLLGTSLTGFALGVWVLEQTGRVTLFGFIALATALPGLVASPWLGALVDRWPRKRSLLVADCGAAVGTLALVLLLWADHLEVWHICATLAVASVCQGLQWPAYSAATTLLVPKKHLGRASGMVQSAQAGVMVVAPVLAGALYPIIGLAGIVTVDFVSFFAAIGCLLLIEIPDPAERQARKGSKTRMWDDISEGLRYLKERSGLLTLLGFFASINLFLGMAQLLYSPLVLSYGDSRQLGLALSTGSVGLLLGGLVMGAWGGGKKRLPWILGSAVVMGLFTTLTGLRESTALIAIGMFGAFFAVQIMNGCSQALWQSKTDPAVQGRVFALRRMLARGSLPVAYLVVGPLADHLFEPALLPDGALAAGLGPWLGTGPGRGIGLMLVLLGIATLGCALLALSLPRVRRIEVELEDQIPDDPEPTVETREQPTLRASGGDPTASHPPPDTAVPTTGEEG